MSTPRSDVGAMQRLPLRLRQRVVDLHRDVHPRVDLVLDAEVIRPAHQHRAGHARGLGRSAGVAEREWNDQRRREAGSGGESRRRGDRRPAQAPARVDVVADREKRGAQQRAAGTSPVMTDGGRERRPQPGRVERLDPVEQRGTDGERRDLCCASQRATPCRAGPPPARRRRVVPPTCSPRMSRGAPSRRSTMPAMTQVVCSASGMRRRSGEATPGRYGARARRASSAGRPRAVAAAASALPRPRTWSGTWSTSPLPANAPSASTRRSSAHPVTGRPSRWRTSKARYTAGSSAASAGPAARRLPRAARSGRPWASRTAMTPSSTAARPPGAITVSRTSGNRRPRSTGVSPWTRAGLSGSR